SGRRIFFGRHTTSQKQRTHASDEGSKGDGDAKKIQPHHRTELPALCRRQACRAGLGGIPDRTEIIQQNFNSSCAPQGGDYDPGNRYEKKRYEIGRASCRERVERE